MLHHRMTWLTAFVLGCGSLAPGTIPIASGQEKNADLLFRKAEELSDSDPKDTKMKQSHCKVYKVKLDEGKAYRIDLSSKDFDTFLRVENANGKEVAFNDDIDLANKILDSRVLYIAPKSGEYRLIVTTYDPAKTGNFVLEMKLADKKETEEARLQARMDNFSDSSLAEQKQFIQDVVKSFQAKDGELTFKDAQTAAMLFMMLDDSNVEFARSTGKSFIKIFEGASDKKVAGLAGFLKPQLKKLDKIGTEIEVAGKTTDGKEFDLKNLKGKVVLVDFWATWCGPCIAEIPNIETAYKKYHGKGFEVIGITRDEKDEEVIEFTKAKKLPWSTIGVADSDKLAERYEVTAIPQPILIGRDGRIVSMRARGPQLERLLARLLSEKK